MLEFVSVLISSIPTVVIGGMIKVNSVAFVRESRITNKPNWLPLLAQVIPYNPEFWVCDPSKGYPFRIRVSVLFYYVVTSNAQKTPWEVPIINNWGYRDKDVREGG